MAQLPTASAGEKEFGFVLPLFAHPGPESLYRRSSKRSAALLSPFTFAADMGTATQIDVETTQIYLDANLALKEDALKKTSPLNARVGRFNPDDQLLSFLRNL